jgi:hypothetical protein
MLRQATRLDSTAKSVNIFMVFGDNFSSALTVKGTTCNNMKAVKRNSGIAETLTIDILPREMVSGLKARTNSMAKLAASTIESGSVPTLP